MRSRAEGAGAPARVARAAGVALLALAWWGQGARLEEPVAPRPVRWDAPAAAPLAAGVRQWLLARGAAAGRAGAGAAKAAVSAAPPVVLGVIPEGAGRALLAALPAAGVPVRWHDATGAAGGAVQGAVVPGPEAPLEVRGVAGRSGVLVLRDRGGVLDSLALPPGRVQGWRLTTAQGPVTLQWPAGAGPPVAAGVVPTAAVAADADAPRGGASPRTVRVLARPGWEAKFVAAALEEAGWRVEGRWSVSPVAEVTVGPGRPGTPLDPAHLAAVVVLDSAAGAGEGAAVRRYVEAGGGLLLAGDGVRWPAGRAGARPPWRPVELLGTRRGVEGGVRSGTPREGLDRVRLAPVAGARVLARGADGAPVVVAQAHGRGRVVAVAYQESWRWRMAGEDDGIAGHRAWWDGVVRLAAAHPGGATAGTSPFPGEGAPWLDLVARLGAPDSGTLAFEAAPRAAPAPWWWRLRAAADRAGGVLYLAAALLLLAEWRARRLRGAP